MNEERDIEQPYRLAFLAAFDLLARACELMKERSDGKIPGPILVGGAAAELFSGGAFMSGDFDFVTPWQEAFEQALLDLGFIRPRSPGQIARGLFHPETQASVEVVGSRLMDGKADPKKIFTSVSVVGNSE